MESDGGVGQIVEGIRVVRAQAGGHVKPVHEHGRAALARVLEDVKRLQPGPRRM